MQRRALVVAFAAGAARLAAAQRAEGRPHLDISMRELQARAGARFPAIVGVPGLIVLRFDAPRLQALPERQKLSATLPARLEGVDAGAAQAGEVEIAFALRYVAEDRTVRAHGFEALALRWPGLRPDFAAQLQLLLPQLAREALAEVVLHRMSPQELALPDTMGFAPQTLDVTDRGLVVWFAPK